MPKISYAAPTGVAQCPKALTHELSVGGVL